MMTDAQLWTQVQRDADEWNEDWGERSAEDKEAAWTLAKTLDAQARAVQSR